MAARRALGIEVLEDGARLAVLELGSGSGPATIERVATLEARGRGLEGAIAESVRALGATRLPCALAWAPLQDRPQHHFLDAPVLRDAERARYAQRQLRKMPGASPDDRWEVQSIGPIELADRPGIQLLALGLSPEAQRRLEALARALPVRLRLATSVPQALLELGERLGPLAAARGAVPGAESPARAVVTLHREMSTLIISLGGRLRFAREFDPTLVVPFSGDPGEPLEAEAAQALAEDVVRSLRYFNQRNGQTPVASLLVAGDPQLARAVLPGLEALANCPVAELGSALAPNLKPGPDVAGDVDPYAVALGLAAAAGAQRRAVSFLGGAESPNLLPGSLRHQTERRTLWLGTAAVLAVVILGIGAVAGRIRAGSSDLLQRNEALEQERRALQSRLAGAEETQRELAGVDVWRARFTALPAYHKAWGDLLVGLAAAAPPRLVFTSVNIVRQGATYQARVEGKIRGPDVSRLEEDLRAFARSVGALPGVRAVSLSPLVLKPRAGGEFALEPRIEFVFENPWPFGQG